MAIESGIGVSIRRIKEVTAGTLPSTPTFITLRSNTRNVNVTKNLLESAEVASHGQEVENRHGFRQVEGSLMSELVTGNADDLIAAALRGTWSASAYTITGGTCACTNPATFSRVGATYITDGLKPGDIITTSGFSNAVNNGIWQVVAVPTETSITVAVSATTSKQVVTETSSVGKTIAFAGRRASTGITQTTFSFERAFSTTSIFQQFLGVTPTGLTLSVQPEQIATLDIPVIGLKSQATTTSTVATAVTAAPTGSPYDAFSGGVLLNGNIASVLTGLTLTVALNRNLTPVVGDYYSPGIFEGRMQVSGEATVMFESAAMYNLFYNETTTATGIRLNDPDGVNAIGIWLPRTKWNTAPIDPGQTGPVIQTMSFRCLYDSTLGYTMSWFRTNSAA